MFGIRDSKNDAGPDEKKGNQLFVWFDISSAGDGYSREVHHDKAERVIVLIIYFSDHADAGGTGGEFCVHEKIEGVDLEYGAMRPDPSLLKLSDVIEPERNLGVLFLSTPDSYHSVRKIEGARRSRKFIYVGITLSSGSAWSDGVI